MREVYGVWSTEQAWSMHSNIISRRRGNHVTYNLDNSCQLPRILRRRNSTHSFYTFSFTSSTIILSTVLMVTANAMSIKASVI